MLNPNHRGKKEARREKKSPPNHNRIKGVLLEKVVADFFDEPGAKVERNVRLFPVGGDQNRQREIDVLITAQIGGMPVRFAFQCKNEKEPIDVDKIDSFVGALDDVGIPRQYGIFVCVNGYTSGAAERAKKAGIKTFVVAGLTKDRLRSETIVAVQHSVFLIPRVTLLSVENNISEVEFYGHFALFSSAPQKPVGTICDLVLSKWLNGEIPAEMGAYEFEMEAPKDWHQFYKGENVPPQKISAKVEVVGVTMTISGAAETHRLIEAETKQTDKIKTNIQFKHFQEGEVIPLKTFQTENELKDFVEKSGDVRLLLKTKLPKIIINNNYYPYSKKVVEKQFEQIRRYGDDFSLATQEMVEAEMWEINQNELFSMGKFGFGGMPLPIITTDDDGDLVDVTLLFTKGEFDKVIALKHRYEKNRYEPLGELLAWSYLEKSRAIFEKAQAKEGIAKERLITESLEKVNAALEIDPRMLPAVDHLSTVLFDRGDYKEALRAVDYIIAREPKDVRAWADRALILTELTDLDEALEAANKAVALIKQEDSDDNLRRIVCVRRAIIYYKQNQLRTAWKDLLKAWEIEPFGVVENWSLHQMIFEITNSVRKIEGYLLQLEIIWFVAACHGKNGNLGEAKRLADDAARTLEGCKPLSEVEGSIYAKGILNTDLTEKVLRRSADRLLEMNDEKLAQEQIVRIMAWGQKNLGTDFHLII